MRGKEPLKWGGRVQRVVSFVRIWGLLLARSFFRFDSDVVCFLGNMGEGPELTLIDLCRLPLYCSLFLALIMPYFSKNKTHVSV